MATIIDKLIVSLGLDATDFTRGQKDVDNAQKKNREGSEKTRKTFEEDGKKTVEAFKKMRNEVLALVASFVGLNAIREFTENITHSDASIGRMAKTLGMNTQDLWTWEKAMAQFGVTAQETDSALSSLTDLQQSWMHGAPVTSEMSRALTMAGVDVIKFHSNTTTATDKLMMLSEAFQKIGAPAAEDLAKPLGLSRQLVAALARGPLALQEMLKAQRALGPLTDEQAAAAQRREQEWANLQTRIENFQRYLVGTFWPIVEPIILKMMHWWDVNQVAVIDAIKQAIAFLGGEFKKIPWHDIGEDIKAIASAANSAAQSFGGWGKSIEYLLGAYLALKTAGGILGLMSLLRGAGVIGTAGAVASGAGAAAATGGVFAAGGAATLGGLGIMGAVIAAIGGLITWGLLELTKDTKQSGGTEQLRKSQGGRGYMVGHDLYAASRSEGAATSTSTSSNAHIDNINIYTTGDPADMANSLNRVFQQMGFTTPANQGSR